MPEKFEQKIPETDPESIKEFEEAEMEKVTPYPEDVEKLKKELEGAEKQETAEKRFEERLDLLFRENKKDLTEEERAHLNEIHQKAEDADTPWVFGLLKEIGMRGQKNEILEFKPEDVDVLKEIIKEYPEIKPEEGLTKKEFEVLRLGLEASKEKEGEIIEKIKAAEAAEGKVPEEVFEQKVEEIRQKAKEAPIFGEQKRTEAEARSEEAKLYLEELRKLGYSYVLEPGLEPKEGGIKAFWGLLRGKEKVKVVDKDDNDNPLMKEGKPAEFEVKVNWWGRYPGEDLLNFLKTELQNKIIESSKKEPEKEESQLPTVEELRKELTERIGPEKMQQLDDLEGKLSRGAISMEEYSKESSGIIKEAAEEIKKQKKQASEEQEAGAEKAEGVQQEGEKLKELTEEEKRSLISTASNFEELAGAIDRIGSIEGSGGIKYGPEKIKETIKKEVLGDMIEDIRQKKTTPDSPLVQHVLRLFTRTYGLRDKVYELLKAEAPSEVESKKEDEPTGKKKIKWLEEGWETIKEGGSPTMVPRRLEAYLSKHGIKENEIKKMKADPIEVWKKAREIYEKEQE